MNTDDNIRALIVGGSGGVGASLSRELAQRGATVCVHGGRDRKKFDAHIRDLRLISPSIIPLWAPIKGVEKFVHTVKKRGVFNVVIINYGPVLYKPISTCSYRDWEEMAQKNFVLPATLISSCAATMKEQKYARIIVFGPDWSNEMRGYRSMAAYAAAKWALCSVVLSLKKQTAHHNFRCYAIFPGYISEDDTPPPQESERERYKYTRSVRAITNTVIKLLTYRPPPEFNPLIGIDKIPSIEYD